MFQRLAKASAKRKTSETEEEEDGGGSGGGGLVMEIAESRCVGMATIFF